MSTATYVLYSSDTLMETPGQPRRQSKLCLSCHDGTVALDAYGGNAGQTMMSGVALVGTDLSDDHPVGIRWNHQYQGTFAGCGKCHQVQGGVKFISPLVFYGSSGDKTIECMTCHEPHNQVPSGNAGMLRITKLGSELCLHCHEWGS